MASKMAKLLPVAILAILTMLQRRDQHKSTRIFGERQKYARTCRVQYRCGTQTALL